MPRRSAYALDFATASAHPDWVLKDPAARPSTWAARLAADFGNPAYRAWWIAQAAARPPARGLYVDDVLMERRATPLRRRDQRPRPADRRDDDRGQLAALHGRLHGRAARRAPDRRARPRRALVQGRHARRHRSASSPPPTRSRSRRASTTRRSSAAGHLRLGVARRLRRAPQAAGRGVILDSYADAPAARAVRPGHRAAARPARCPRQRRLDRPDRCWTGYDVRSRPAGRRALPGRASGGAIRRGVVLVNPPGNGTRTSRSAPASPTSTASPRRS